MDDIRLTAAQTAELAKLSTDISKLQQILTRAERAGLPVEDIRKRLQQAESLRQGLLREFGPAGA